MCLRDLVTRGFDISLHRKVITHGGREQNLDMINLILGRNWEIEDYGWFSYTEAELMRLLEHPSVKALGGLMKRAEAGQGYPTIDRGDKWKYRLM